MSEPRIALIVEEAESLGWAKLPCDKPCPPPADTVAALEQVLLSWLGWDAKGPKTVFCFPSKNIETWLAAALVPEKVQSLRALECISDVMSQLPAKHRIKKRIIDYRDKAPVVTARWSTVREHCSQADVFQCDVTRAMSGS